MFSTINPRCDYMPTITESLEISGNSFEAKQTPLSDENTDLNKNIISSTVKDNKCNMERYMNNNNNMESEKNNMNQKHIDNHVPSIMDYVRRSSDGKGSAHATLSAPKINQEVATKNIHLSNYINDLDGGKVKSKDQVKNSTSKMNASVPVPSVNVQYRKKWSGFSIQSS
uniref:Uncharacterized protein n=1 Tax=Clytia hemisphaerica TaxID=252671 RepID=A0A7M5V6X4_9CNID